MAARALSAALSPLLPGRCPWTAFVRRAISLALQAGLTALAAQPESSGVSHSPLLWLVLSTARLQGRFSTPVPSTSGLLSVAQACLTTAPTPATSPVLPRPLETTRPQQHGKDWGEFRVAPERSS